MIQGISYHFQSAYVAVSTSADKNMLGIRSPDTGVVYITSLSAFSDYNAADDRIRFELVLSSSALSGGAAITPAPTNSMHAAYGTIAGGNGSVIGGNTAITNHTASGGVRGEAEDTAVNEINLLANVEEEFVRVPPGAWLTVIQKFANGFPANAQNIRFVGNLTLV